MIKIFHRYVFFLFVKNAVLALFALGFLFFFQQFFTDLLSPEFSWNQVLYYNALYIPFVFVHMSPPALLMGMVMTLSHLNRTQEWVAFYSIGLSLPRLVMSIFIGVVGYAFFLMAIQDRLLPEFHKARTLYFSKEIKKRKDFFLDFKKDKIWYRSQNQIYNFGYFDDRARIIHQMSIYTLGPHRALGEGVLLAGLDFSLTEVTTASRAILQPSSEGSRWKLQNGALTSFSSEDPFPRTEYFQEREINLMESIQDFQQIEKEVDGLSTKALADYIKRMQKMGADTRNYQVKYHARMSLSFTGLVLCFLGVPFSLSFRRSEGMARDLGMCLGITFLYWLFYSVGLSLGKGGQLPPLLAAWLPTVLFGVLAAVLIIRKVRSR